MYKHTLLWPNKKQNSSPNPLTAEDTGQPSLFSSDEGGQFSFCPFYFTLFKLASSLGAVH